MPIHTKTSAGYKLITSAWVKVDGEWKLVPDIYTNIAGIWKRVHANIGVFTFSATLSGTQYNYNLYNVLVAAGWDGISIVHATLTLSSSAILSSTSTGAYALSTGASYPEGSSLVLINNGKILGKGGAGGAGSIVDASPSNGQFGGPALAVGLPCTLYNYGLIAGGGGGGAGGRTMRADSYNSTYAEGGGGGGGIGVAVGGTASAGAYAGATSTLTGAGSGGSGETSWVVAGKQGFAYTAETGGSGGGYAATGGIGYGGSYIANGNVSYYKTGFSGIGGAGGAALTGNALITYAVSGTITGVKL